MAYCPHCQTDLGANPTASVCTNRGKPLASPPSTLQRPVIGQLTKAGIILTLLWVVLVNFMEHCRGTRMQDTLRHNNAWVNPLQPQHLPDGEAGKQAAVSLVDDTAMQRTQSREKQAAQERSNSPK